MNAYALLTLLILGHLCQIQAATLSGPAMTKDDAKKLLTEELSRSIVDHRAELIEALKRIKGKFDETSEQIHPVVATVVVPVVKVLVNGAASGAVGALVGKLLESDRDKSPAPSL
ncbi:uncharacterized protein LOC119163477 [Rhipicephalus microplus]|nr:uncharacterized protein LOC119163477 [Rhipicephalus microplus]